MVAIPTEWRRDTATEASDVVLREGGYRLTPQRYLILRVIEEAREHLSTEQVIKLAQERNPCVSQATVYRTLSLLQVLGLIHATHLSGKQVCYEVVVGHTHHHFVCRSCHCVLHLDLDLLGDLPLHLSQQYGFNSLHLELTATGYCEVCWRTLQQAHCGVIEGELFPIPSRELP